MMPPGARPAGVVLIVGSSLFIVGASLAPEMGRVFFAPLREHLTIIERHVRQWRLMNALMIASIVGTAAGLALFASLLRAGGDPWRSTAGWVGYAFGGVLWVITLAFRSTATVEAARSARRTETVPDWLEPLGAFTGLLYTIYMLTAYLALALFGWGVLRTDVVSHSVGTFTVVWSYALGLSFVSRTKLGMIGEIPALVHIPTLVFGIWLVK